MIDIAENMSPVLKRLGAVEGDELTVRSAHGKLSGVVSTLANAVLALIKLSAGLFFGNVALTADGLNNLSDTGSAVISFIGFKISSMPADAKHPYGHARVEYVASMAVAIIIFIMGIESIISSFGALIKPVYRQTSPLEFIALGISIAVKLALGIYNRRLGKRIDSDLVLAVSQDSFSDVLSSVAVMVSVFIQYRFSIVLDGVAGIFVSILIIASGINIVRASLDKILGEPPTKDMVEKIEKFVLGYDGILGAHDLIIHDYGPCRCFVSIHAEVDASVNILESHDVIDKIERDALRILNIQMVVHMDPVRLDCPVIGNSSRLIAKTLRELSAELDFHDLRVVDGSVSHTFIFDVLMPVSCDISKDEILQRLREALGTSYKNSELVVTFDTNYVK